MPDIPICADRGGLIAKSAGGDGCFRGDGENIEKMGDLLPERGCDAVQGSSQTTISKTQLSIVDLSASVEDEKSGSKSAQKSQYMEYVNVLQPAGPKPRKPSEKSGASAKESTQSGEKDGEGEKPTDDQQQRQTQGAAINRGKRRRTASANDIVKMEDADDEVAIEVPAISQIFKATDKMVHLKGGETRWMFDACQKSEAQTKKLLSFMKGDIKGIRNEMERSQVSERRVNTLEQNMAAVNKTSEWCVTTIIGMFMQLGWELPPMGEEVASVVDDLGGVDSIQALFAPGDMEDGMVIATNNELGEDGQVQDQQVMRADDQASLASYQGRDEMLANPGGDGGAPHNQDQEARRSQERRNQLGGVPELPRQLERVTSMTTAGGFVAMKEFFSGNDDESLRVFLKKFDIWFAGCKLPIADKGIRLTMQLKGLAAEAIIDLEEHEYTNYDKVKECLCLNFNKGETEQLVAKAAIEKISYGEMESFGKFIIELTKLVKKVYPEKRGADLNERVFETAMRRLPPEFVVAMNRQQVKTLDDLKMHGPAEEANQKFLDMSRPEKIRRTPEAVRAIIDDEEANTMAQIRHPQQGVQRQPRGLPPAQGMQGPQRPRQAFQGVQRAQTDVQPICFKCRQPGHFANNCQQNQAMVPRRSPQGGYQQPQYRQQGRRQQNIPQGQGNANRQGVQCYHCQGMGHFAYECRKKLRSMQQQQQPQQFQRRQQGLQEQRIADNAAQRAVETLLGRFASMNFGPHGGQMPQYQQFQQQQPQQYMQLPQQNTFALAPPSVASQNQGGQQQPPTQGGPSRQTRDNRVNVMSGAVVQQAPISDAQISGKPMTIEELQQKFENLERQYEYVVTKTYQREQEINPDPDLLATLQRHDELALPALVPVEKRLAVIPVKVNGVHMRALYDTGASITIASRTVADIAGIDLEENDQKVQSATGHIARMTKKGLACLTIGNHSRDVEVNFAEDDQIGVSSPYDMIVGVGTLIEFPPMTLDAKRRKLKINDNVGVELDLRTKGELLREERKVFAIEEKTIAAHTGAMVTVLVDSSLGTNTKIMTVEPSGVEYAECLLNVDSDNRSTIWILNESDQPIQVHKRMTVGKALNVIGDDDNLANYPEITMAVIEAWDKVKEVDPTYKIDYSGCDALPEQIDKLEALLDRYGEQFSKNGYDLGLARVSPMQIRTTTDIPFKPSIYPIPKNAKDDLQKQIGMMIQSGCIVESDTPWVSPIVMVKKKNGELRPCIDLRKLNEITVPDHFPLPRLSDTLDRVAGKAWLTGLDLNKGYQQLELDEDASRKCGIITPWGVYQCKTMPFGLRNAPSAFMRMMTKIMEGLEDICVIYMDDFIVMTEEDDFDQHLKDIEKVLLRLKQYNIKANPKKCEVARRKITFLGHKVSNQGIEPDDRNIIKIKEFPAPKNRKEVKRFLGMCSFFRRFIRRYAQIASPLVALTGLEAEWEWKDTQQQAFEELRNLLSAKPILAFPDESKDYHLFVDASNNALGIALMQEKGEHVAGRPVDYSHIAFYSRQFSQSERKWPIVQKELVSIVEGLRWSRYYTYGRKVIVHTDHRPLIHLIKKRTTHPNLARWLIELQQYGDDTLQIQYIEGERNTVADALSRLESAMDGMNEQELEDLIKGPFCMDVEGDQDHIAAIGKVRESRESVPSGSGTIEHVLMDGEKSIQELQDGDPQLKSAILFITNKESTDNIEDENVKWYVDNCELDTEGVLIYKKPAENGRKPIIVPESLRKDLFSQFHTLKIGGGHSCVDRTLSKMWRYAWKGKHRDIGLWHKECHDCQLRAPKRYKVPLLMTNLDQVFERMGIDLCGPLFATSKGNLHYVVAIDMFSKWIVCVPVPDTKALTVAKALYDNVILTFGCPKELLSDNAKTFTSNFFEEYMTMLGIKKLRCTPYHHDGNAITERSIRDCSNMIAKYLEEARRDNVQLEWDDLVREIAFCHNVTKHSTIGMSPFYLMFGREPTFPADLLLQARTTRDQPGMKEFRENLIKTIETARGMAADNMRISMEEVKRQADKRAKESDVEVGELVLYRDYSPRVGMSEKFKNPWLTIHRVKAIKGQHAWIVPRNQPNNEPKRVHLNQIKRYYCEEERLQAKQQEPVTVPGARKERRAKKAQAITKQPGAEREAPTPKAVERQTARGMKLRTLIRDEHGRTRAAK